MAGPRSALLSRRSDPWLIGGAAVALWLAIEVAARAGAPKPPLGGHVLSWAVATVGAAHFGLSYHLAYGDRQAGPRRHPAALIWVPVGTVAAVLAAWHLMPAGATGGSFRLLLSIVFALTIWHYVKQAYGVARVAAALSGFEVDGVTNLALRYGMYPVWGLSLTRLLTGDNGSILGYRVGADVLPHWADTVAADASVAGMAVIAATLLAASIRNGCVVPAAVWTPAAAGFLWVAYPPDLTGTVAVLSAIHAVQYLTCGYRAERAWADERAQEQPRIWLLCVFAAAAVGGLFATSWLAPAVAEITGGRISNSAVAVSLFIVLNIHHYAIDATIWRRRGTHVKRMTAARPSPLPAAATALATLP